MYSSVRKKRNENTITVPFPSFFVEMTCVCFFEDGTSESESQGVH